MFNFPINFVKPIYMDGGTKELQTFFKNVTKKATRKKPMKRRKGTLELRGEGMDTTPY